jgi:isopentenyl diphosphate isomerase/L-lactate dehydrogenase-like FMN-dependent dehydrogenase
MKRGSVASVLNIDEMRERAKWLPAAVFDAIDGGAGDELTMRANRSAYQCIWLRPRALVDVSSIDTSTTVLGQKISFPLMLDPCGFARMAHSAAELAAARAAGSAGTVFVVSGASSYSLEDIAKTATGPLWYQLYVPPDRDVAETLIDRVEKAGYPVLCVTIDTAIAGKRERDYRNKLTVPVTMSPRLILSALSNPRWAMDFMLGRVGGSGISGSYNAVRTAVWNLGNTVNHLKSVTVADIQWIRERWKGKLVLKGIMRGDECPQLIDLGVDGLVVSNHGGRNLDCVRATINILPEVISAVGGRAEVFVDGGIRRGTDVVKALAFGARACLVGRPYMFGLAVAGEAGVARVLEIFRTEVEQTMGLLGCPTVADIDSNFVYSEHSAHETPVAGYVDVSTSNFRPRRVSE